MKRRIRLKSEEYTKKDVVYIFIKIIIRMKYYKNGKKGFEEN